ncbi:MAG TPA: ATP-binding protein [Gemmatimonadaceae bacterium]
MSSIPPLLDRLTHHRALGAAPSEELAWLASHGVGRSFAVGETSTRKAQPEEWLLIVLSGHLAIHVDRGAGSRKVAGWRQGDVCGLMPYSRGGAPPGDTVAEEPTDVLAIHRDVIPEMIRECPRVTAVLVHAMLDRARHFTSSDLHDEKLLSLGKLAAGLAHELNNPASAAARSAKLLAATFGESEAAARALAAERLSDAQLVEVDGVRALCEPGAVPSARSPIERADREEALGGWFDAHGFDADYAAALSDSNVTPAALDALAAAIGGDALGAALRSIGSGRLMRLLVGEIDASVSRIYELVAAVKGFTYMDRAATREPIDIRRSLTDTLAVLGAKTRAKSVVVELALPADLPAVHASGAELNQVWANIIDNALDAVASAGRVEVTASRQMERVVVCIADDGPGIAPEIQGRIFDPFFTTKPVGQGTGLGLDIVRRLLQRSDGEIEVESRPGRTEFRVSLREDTGRA